MLEYISYKVRRTHKDVKQLYYEAFPKEERFPFLGLTYLSKKYVDFYGIYDKNKFVGMIYNVCYKDIVFIFYLAIHKNHRGQGYGTQILSDMKSKYQGCRLILSMETMDKEASNYQQRLNRKAFYESNGFYDLGYSVTEVGVTYDFLCYHDLGQKVSLEEYKELMKNYFGDKLYHYVYQKFILGKESV